MFDKDISKVCDASFMMVTSQKEVDKEIKKINKAIIHAYRYKWPILSKNFVLHADKEKALPEIQQHKLNLTNLDNAPASSLRQVKPVRQSELLRSNKRSAHRDLQKVLRIKRKLGQLEESNSVPQREPKRAANGYIVFLKQTYAKFAKDYPDKNLKEINFMLAQKWKSMSEEERAEFAEIGTSEFQQKKEEWAKYWKLEALNIQHIKELWPSCAQYDIVLRWVVTFWKQKTTGMCQTLA